MNLVDFMTESILILGSRGMLGSDLSAVFSGPGLTAWDKEELDVTNREAVIGAISRLKPQLVINATGYTDVDGAEQNRGATFALNDEAVKNIVAVSAAVGARLIHFSTEYVFDGQNQAGYNESVASNPQNVYGQSKAAGEKHVLGYERGYLIRTSWLYGQAAQRGKPRGVNFIDTVLKLASEKDEVRVVNDQYGKLTYTKDLAQAVRQLVVGPYEPGVYHLVNEGVTSWYDVAGEVFRLRGIKIPLVPISSAEYPMPAKRPKYGVLLNNKFPAFRPWPQALADYLSP